MLYFSDMLFYLQEGRPITGVEYLKQKFGPTARHLTAAVRELESERRLKMTEDSYHGFYKKSYEALVSYSPSRLSDEEGDLLREVANFVRGKTAREISDLSHNSAWEAADMGEVILYFTALRLIPDEPSEADRTWALDSARQHAAERFV